MTVQNSNVKNIYIGNGSTTSFPFTFPCPKAEYIKVFVRKNNLIAQTDNFTVDLDKATVTYPKSGTPLAAGENLVILRELPLEQPLNLVNQGPFFAEDIETTLDEEVMMIQQLREQLGRSLTVPVDIDAENAFETSVPIKPGMSFRVKDDGSGFEETEDPARVLPLASDALKKAETARDVAIAKADAAGASAVSAAESEVAADRSATQAEAAKTAAKASEVAAKASQDAAKVSETNAKASEVAAKTSADKAKVSETNAKSSETVATTKASEASVSATNAKASEVAAKASETNAKTSETNAKASETSASNSAKSASTSASTATIKASEASVSATNAKTSETNAGKSATTATTKASEANVSATNAKASETASKTSETNAKASETSASNSAKTASTNATTATQQATKATTEANRAKTEADRAKTAADSVGNPVVNITQSNGNLTVTKGDGSSDTLTVTPAKASQAEAEAGTDDTKMMTPLKTKQAVEAYKTFKGASETSGGAKGFVPAPKAKENMSFLRGDGTWVELSTSLAPAPVSRRKIEVEGSTVRLWWYDPEPIRADGNVVADWTKTVIVKKQGSYPANPFDGTVVVTTTTKNKYATNPYVDTQASPDNWFYRAFPYNEGTFNNEVFNKFGFFSYAVYIDEEDPVEETCVHKVAGYENYHLENAAMNFTTDKFYWGGWENAQFMPKPCMLRSNGTVAYYLNPDDYTQKEGGGSSDVTNTAFDGNAMMEWPTIFTKIKREGSKLYLFFASERLDSEYECYSTLKSDGSYAKNFYTPIYEGSVISNKMRSLSTNARPTGSTTAENEAKYATANGTGWNTTVWADEQLMQMLGVLIFGRLNIQKACGYNCGSSSGGLTHNCGSGNTKGMFYGKASTGPTATKYFGMENWWGHRWRRCNGIMLVGYNFKIKMTQHTRDGSTVSGYNRTGDGYIDTGLKCPGANGSYIKNVHGHKLAAFLPNVVSGASDTTYFCDAAWSAGGTTMLLCGGSVSNGGASGLFACLLLHAPSNSSWSYGASLSYHHL